MPLNALGEFFLQPLFELILHILGYLTARVVVPVVTLGYVQVETHRGKFVKPGRGRLPRRPGGGRLMDPDLAAFWGVMFWLTAGGIVLVVRALAH